jgi:hypothetical protein
VTRETQSNLFFIREYKEKQMDTEQLFVHYNFGGTIFVIITILWIIRHEYSETTCSFDLYLNLSSEGSSFRKNDDTLLPIQEVKRMIRSCTKEFVLIPCTVFVSGENEGGAHATFIIIDNLSNKLEYYDPHGSEIEVLHDEIDNLSLNYDINRSINNIASILGLTRETPPVYFGTQTFASTQESNVEDIGYCTIHVLLLVFYRLANSNLSMTEVTMGLQSFTCIDLNAAMNKLAYKVMRIVYELVKYYGITNEFNMEKINYRLYNEGIMTPSTTMHAMLRDLPPFNPELLSDY